MQSLIIASVEASEIGEIGEVEPRRLGGGDGPRGLGDCEPADWSLKMSLVRGRGILCLEAPPEFEQKEKLISMAIYCQ